MSTQPFAQPSPGFLRMLEYFNAYAQLAAAGIHQVQTDMQAGQHVQAVTDSLSAVGAGLAYAVPAWAPEIAASLTVAQGLVAVIDSLFHHPASPAIHNSLDSAAAPAAPASTTTYLGSPQPAVTNPNL